MRVSKDSILYRWNKRKQDFEYCYPPANIPTKSAGRLIAHHVAISKATNDQTLLQELDARGFDITTFRVSIKLKPEHTTGD